MSFVSNLSFLNIVYFLEKRINGPTLYVVNVLSVNNPNSFLMSNEYHRILIKSLTFVINTSKSFEYVNCLFAMYIIRQWFSKYDAKDPQILTFCEGSLPKIYKSMDFMHSEYNWPHF